MKKILFYLLITFAAITITGCDDDDSFNAADVTPVEALYAPEDNAFFDLEAQSSAVFEWQAAKAADNGVVLYEVAFDLADGDFSNPIFVMPSDGNGFQNTLTIPFTELNRIAGFAGIQPENTGKLKWTVHSSKGINVKKSDVFRTFELERPGGFPTPDQLFLTGDATEGGTDLSMAVPFKKTGSDNFEIYTSLKPGSYQIITRTSGTPEVFHVEDNKLKADGETTITDSENIYRLRLDFSDGSVSISTIDKVELWFPTFGEFQFTFDYAGNGTWEALNEHIEFNEVSYGREERYKFRFTVTTAGNTAEEWYGSTNADNQRPTSDSPESYFYMVPAPSDEYTNTFKFATEVDMADVNITILFNADVEEYVHKIEIL